MTRACPQRFLWIHLVQNLEQYWLDSDKILSKCAIYPSSYMVQILLKSDHAEQFAGVGKRNPLHRPEKVKKAQV